MPDAIREGGYEPLVFNRSGMPVPSLDSQPEARTEYLVRPCIGFGKLGHHHRLVQHMGSQSLGERIDWFPRLVAIARMVPPSLDVIGEWYQASLAPVSVTLPRSVGARVERAPSGLCNLIRSQDAPLGFLEQ